MLIQDQSMLKKTLKIKNMTLNHIAGCYVNAEKQKQCEFSTNFLNIDEEEQFKYLDLLKKMMSCKIDNTLQTLEIIDDDNQKLLESLRQAELTQKPLLDAFYDRVIQIYENIDEYCIFLFYSVYDIPEKGSDQAYQDESDAVYAAVYGLVCPLVMSKPGLSYDPKTNEIKNRDRDKVVGPPTIGFMYPDLNDGCIDTSKVVYAMVDKKNLHPEFSKSVLGCEKNMTAAEQKEVFDAALEDIIENQNINIVSNFSDNISEMIERAEVNAKTPSFSTSEVKDMLIKSGVDEEKAEEFEQNYKNLTSDEDNIRLDNVIDRKKKTYKTPDITINVSPDKRHLVKTETRDGQEYIVISLNTNVEINGVMTILEEG